MKVLIAMDESDNATKALECKPFRVFPPNAASSWIYECVFFNQRKEQCYCLNRH